MSTASGILDNYKLFRRLHYAPTTANIDNHWTNPAGSSASRGNDAESFSSAQKHGKHSLQHTNVGNVLFSILTSESFSRDRNVLTSRIPPAVSSSTFRFVSENVVENNDDGNGHLKRLTRSVSHMDILCNYRSHAYATQNCASVAAAPGMATAGSSQPDSHEEDPLGRRAHGV